MQDYLDFITSNIVVRLPFRQMLREQWAGA